MADSVKAKIYFPSQNAFFHQVSARISESSVFNSPRFAIFPGFCDVHVHFREPGFSYKETIASGDRKSVV